MAAQGRERGVTAKGEPGLQIHKTGSSEDVQFMSQGARNGRKGRHQSAGVSARL